MGIKYLRGFVREWLKTITLTTPIELQLGREFLVNSVSVEMPLFFIAGAPAGSAAKKEAAERLELEPRDDPQAPSACRLTLPRAILQRMIS
jgi:hypothetical protein